MKKYKVKASLMGSEDSLMWEQLNGKGACLWASEIEEFQIAITKKRIGE